MRERLRHLGLSLLGAIGVAGALAMAPISGAEAQLTGPVTTTTGVYEGLSNFQVQAGDPASGVDVFFGIRYAQAPTGVLRWQPPQAPSTPQGSVETPFPAVAPGAQCPQGRNPVEDCLFLNVYTPANAQPGSNLPVWIWIHGGALVSGSGAIYDPSNMVHENNVIVVTINYRLGALGWLAQSVLEAASPNAFQNTGDAGNYGEMDQQFAMQWVQANIAAFGGDPTKVTIGGESAGGLSTSINLASTVTAPGLFRGAIIESGAYMLHDLPSQQTYELIGQAFVAAVLANSQNVDACMGVTTGSSSIAILGCLDAASPTTILIEQSAVFGSFGISPDFGTKVLPISFLQAFSTGNFIRVPVLQGTNANEGRLFEPADVPTTTSPNGVAIKAAGGPANFDLTNANIFCGTMQNPATCTYAQEIGLFLNELSPGTVFPLATIDRLYPLVAFPDPFLAHNAPSADEGLSQIFTDLVFACNGYDSNVALTHFTPVYAYEFNDPNAPPGDANGFPSASEHASELQFLFNFGSPLSVFEKQLGVEMRQYWATFVKDLNPSVHVTAQWPRFNIASGLVQNLIPGPTLPHPTNTFASEHFCTIWQPILAGEAQQP